MAEEQQTQEQNEVENPKITMEDIVLVQRILALASSRGAFRAEEMSSVGRVYDRVSAFVTHNTPSEEGSEGTTESSEAEGSSESTPES